VNAPTKLVEVMPKTVAFKLDGRDVTAFEGESILKAAERHGVDIPRLCYKEGLRADGNCRSCVVEVKGERVLAPSCCRNVTAGMEVSASSPRALKSQRMVLEMLLSDMPDVGYKWTDGDGEAEATGLVGQHGELSDWVSRLGVEVRPELKALRRQQPRSDISHPAMAVNLDACIQCNRCVRACREEQVNDVIGYAMRGDQSAIVFDLNDPMGDSTCVACGECVQACPTGALMPKPRLAARLLTRKSIQSALFAASAACSPITSRTTSSSAWTDVMVLPTTAACALRADSVLTMRTVPSASPSR